MHVSRSIKNLVLAGALGAGSIVGLAAPVLADTPAHEPAPMVIVLGEGGGGGLQGPGDIANPTPAPQPPQDKAPVPQPEPQPEPQGPGEILNPEGHGDPEPGDLPIANPEDDGPVVNPDLPQGPGDLANDQGCEATHGCEPEVPGDLADRPDTEDDCPAPLGSCDLTDREPADGDTPDSGSDDGTEVLSSGQDRTALPRTGTGLAMMAAAGAALTSLGVALRKATRRR